MTDNEIIKAVGCCIGNTKCDECPMFRTQNCMNKVFGYALDFINRQKAENERLQKNIDGLNIFTKNHIKVIRLQVIKEFAEKLKNCFAISGDYLDIINIIDNLVKEMTEVGK